MKCVDCQNEFVPIIGKPGRPRVRCFGCNPENSGQPNKYVKVAKERRLCASPACGRYFESGLKWRRVCSPQCTYIANRDRILEVQRASHARISKRDRTPRECRFCGKPFVPSYGDLRRGFCSSEHRMAAKHKGNAGSTSRRRAKRFGVRHEPFDKRIVFERDGWICQICGVATPKALSGSLNPNAPQIDHIVAMAKGGDHSIDNTQCACRRCNMKKRDGPPAGQIGLFTSLVNESLKARRRRATPQP